MIEKKKSENNGQTFMDRLIRVHEENDDFTMNDVLAETITLLMGVGKTFFLDSFFNVLKL